MADAALSAPRGLPVGPLGRLGVGLWGIGTLIATEGALFVYLLFTYFYVGATAAPDWLLDARPSFRLSLPITILLLLSSAAAAYGERSVRRGRRGAALLGLGIAILIGILFIVGEWLEWQGKPFRLGTSSYASLFFVTTGFHVAHVAIGVLVLAALFLWTALGYFGPERRHAVAVGVVYWHFVNLVSIAVFLSLYVSPYLGFGR